MEIAQNDWPMERHDPQMTGRTPLKGNMREAPKVVWRHYLGLWTSHLVLTHDKSAEAVLPLPETTFDQRYVRENGDDWSLRLPQVDVDGKGTLVRLPNVSSEKLAKILPDVPGYQRIVFDNAFSIGAEENYGRFYAHDDDDRPKREGGGDKPRLLWQTERIRDMYSPVVAIADTDLDGQVEIVLLTHYHLAIYDPRTGKEKDSVTWKVGRNYGQLDVVDVNGDGRPDFVVQADTPPHFELILNEPEGLRLAWSKRFFPEEDVAVPMDLAVNNLPNAVRDLDGDGRFEFALNIRDFRQDKKWRVVVYDVLSGEPKAEFPDLYLWAVADLDNDGRHEFFLADAPTKTVDRDSFLSVGTFTGTELLPRWKSDDYGRFAMRPYYFPLTVNSASSRGPVHHSTIVAGDVDGDGFSEFFVTVGDRVLGIGRNGENYETKLSVTSPSTVPPTALAVDGNRVLVELNGETGETSVRGGRGEFVSHYPARNFLTTPTVADLDGDGSNEIIVENAAGTLDVLTPFAENPVRWTFRGSAQPIWVTWKTSHTSAPAVDLDGDGKKEFLCCDNANEPLTTIYALRHDGSIYWKSELPGIAPRLTELFRVGRFRSEGWDVLVTVGATTQPEMFCLDGRTGAIRWHKKSWTDDQGQVWPYPNQWTSADLDGDGFHEIYGSYAYIYYALDGKTGEPLRKPVNIWHEVYHRWQSYFAPIPADFDGDGKEEFLLASYSFAIGGVTVMRPNCEIVWEKPLDNKVGASGFQGVGDCDGDGLPEIAFYHLDGRIVCYDGKTGAERWTIPDLQGTHSSSGGHFASGDVDNDGKDEFLYSLGSGEIICLDEDAPGHVLWRASVEGTPDSPLLADVDGDGFAEIVVCTRDGYLNVLK